MINMRSVTLGYYILDLFTSCCYLHARHIFPQIKTSYPVEKTVCLYCFTLERNIFLMNTPYGSVAEFVMWRECR